MQKMLVALVAGASLATSHASAQERFTTDKPSPLKQVRTKEDGPIVRFNGQARLSGQFLVIWEAADDRRKYHQIMFLPDEASSALLPRVAGYAPVKELYISNANEAAPMLLDLASTQTALPQQQVSAEGVATVVIRDYRMVVECDQRYYAARLISAKKNPHLVVSARANERAGC